VRRPLRAWLRSHPSHEIGHREVSGRPARQALQQFLSPHALRSEMHYSRCESGLKRSVKFPGSGYLPQIDAFKFRGHIVRRPGKNAARNLARNTRPAQRASA